MASRVPEIQLTPWRMSRQGPSAHDRKMWMAGWVVLCERRLRKKAREFLERKREKERKERKREKKREKER